MGMDILRCKGIVSVFQKGINKQVILLKKV